VQDWQVRLLISVGLGSLLGFERFLVRKPASLRTVTLVCAGSAIMMILAERVQLSSTTPIDPTRLAQGIVTGVGFLGAGAILRHRGTVFGLTTAAVIWDTAAIGMAAGAGMIDLAIWGTAISLIVLQVYGRLEFWMRKKNARRTSARSTPKGRGCRIEGLASRPPQVDTK
jgi:putative Mg2+ transporter-C (MgtC) family protein